MPSLNSVIRRPIYGTGQKVAYTGTAGSVTVPPYTQSVLIWCSSAALVRVGAVATAADLPIPANTPITIPVGTTDGGPITVSGIQVQSGGNMYVIAMAD